MAREKDVAIIGVAGRFPGAKNIDEFWDNQVNGVESISFFSEEDCLATGVDPALVSHPDYVKAWGVLDDVEMFDANFFGIPGREAEAMDPQHRIFLEIVNEALERSGYDSVAYDGYIGLVWGCGLSTYLIRNLIPNADKLQTLGEYLTFIGNDKDFMGTRASYKLNLRGPAHAVATACSTSLVAAHLGVAQLLSYQSDICVAGGINIKLPQKSGYLYRKNQLKSPDGRCRAFDAKARGTVFGNGTGVVVMKRYSEAMADGDNIYAVIKGSALNNDGSSKAGYTAPSVSGQSEVIAQAHALAGFDPETITFMEAHGTATELGDPIEIKALKKVFKTEKKQYCAITSTKANIGHLDNTAGVTGLIKTALVIKNKKIPPSINFDEPNPEIDFENSPFYVNTRLTDWNPAGGMSRRACVSSFGAGGTNAHMVLEEPRALDPSGPSRPVQLLTLSAKTQTALEDYAANLADFLEQQSDTKLEDVLYTMNVGRVDMTYRRAVVAGNREDMITALRGGAADKVFNDTLNPELEGQTEATNNLIIETKGLVHDTDLAKVLTDLAQLWARGARIDWKNFYRDEWRHRVVAPTYPFQRERYWLDEPTVVPAYERRSPQAVAAEQVDALRQKNPDMAEWFYAQSWRRAPLPANLSAPSEGCVLVFMDRTGIGSALVEQLRGKGLKVVTVETGADWDSREDAYTINPERAIEYNAMLTELGNTGRRPTHILHLWGINDASEENLDLGLTNGFYSLLFIARGLMSAGYLDPVELIHVDDRMFAVNDDEDILPVKAAALGPMRVIPLESANIKSRILDIRQPNSERGHKQLQKGLMHELAAGHRDAVVALRGRTRWVEDHTRVRLEDTPAAQIKDNGTYLITGGYGGIGLTLADYLVENAKANIVLLSRTAPPAREEWQTAAGDESHPAHAKVKAMLALEAKGGRVLPLAADVTDLDQMSSAFEQARQTFGRVDGVIHAAGLTDSSGIKRKSVEESESIFAAKVRGTMILDKIVAENPVDFMMLCSSLAVVRGGNGQVAYTAANAFLDAYACHQALNENGHVVSINWDAWKEVGMAGKYAIGIGIEPAEGGEVFTRALESGMPNVIVSLADLATRKADLLKGLETADSDGEVEKASYPRPDLAEPYAAASTETQTALVRIWEDVLGINPIGVNDDFFELGGDSVTGINLINRLEHFLQATVDLDALFSTPTIAMLAEYFEAEYPDNIGFLVSGSAGGKVIAKTVETGPSNLDDAALQRVRTSMPLIPPAAETSTPRNRHATFILAPQGSGSTLLRVMLAGHSKVWAPPELALLNFTTMSERRTFLEQQDPHWLEGLMAMIMSVEVTDENHAQSYIGQFEKDNKPTKDFYGLLQRFITNDCDLVDKTTSYAYDMEALRRAESWFENARFIHLQRHPFGAMDSLLKTGLDMPTRWYFGKDATLNDQDRAEAAWNVANRNILDFLADIPEERKLSLKYEDLVADPSTAAQAIAGFMNLEFEEDMLLPYKEFRMRMTDGINVGTRMLGDARFNEFKTIDPEEADAWRKTFSAELLSEPSRKLAQALGYQLDEEAQTNTDAADDIDVENMSEDQLDAMLGDLMDEEENT